MAVSIQVHPTAAFAARLEFGPRHQNWRRQVSVLEDAVRIGGGSAAGAGFVLLRGWGCGAAQPSIGGGGTRGRAPLGAVQEVWGGRCDEELVRTGTEMSAAAGCRERDSAGPEGVGKLGWGSEPGAATGPLLEWAGPAVWVDARGKDQGPGPAEAGTVGLKFCGDVRYS